MPPKKAASKAAAVPERRSSRIEVDLKAKPEFCMAQVMKLMAKEEKLREEAADLRKRAEKMRANFQEAADRIRELENPELPAQQREALKEKVKQLVAELQPPKAAGKPKAKTKSKSKAKAKAAAAAKGDEEEVELPRPDIAVHEVNHALMMAHRKELEAEDVNRKVKEILEHVELAQSRIQKMEDMQRDEFLREMDPFAAVGEDQEPAAKRVESVEPEVQPDQPPPLKTVWEEIDEEDFAFRSTMIAKKCARGNAKAKKDILAFLDQARRLRDQTSAKFDFAPFRVETAEGVWESVEVEIHVKRKGKNYEMSHEVTCTECEQASAEQPVHDKKEIRSFLDAWTRDPGSSDEFQISWFTKALLLAQVRRIQNRFRARKRQRAATKIQAYVRCFLMARAVRQMRRSALKIQCCWRGFIGRRAAIHEFQKLRENDPGPRVRLDFTVQHIDYVRLSEESSSVLDFKARVREAIVIAAGKALEPVRPLVKALRSTTPAEPEVDVALCLGELPSSLTVIVRVTPPTVASALSVQSALASCESLPAVMLERLWLVHRMAAAMTSPISVQFDEAATIQDVVKVNLTIVKAVGLLSMGWTGDAVWCTCAVKTERATPERPPPKVRTVARTSTLTPMWAETHEITCCTGDTLEFTICDSVGAGSWREALVILPFEQFHPSGFSGQLPVSGSPEAKLELSIAAPCEVPRCCCGRTFAPEATICKRCGEPRPPAPVEEQEPPTATKSRPSFMSEVLGPRRRNADQKQGRHAKAMEAARLEEDEGLAAACRRVSLHEPPAAPGEESPADAAPSIVSPESAAEAAVPELPFALKSECGSAMPARQQMSSAVARAEGREELAVADRAGWPETQHISPPSGCSTSSTYNDSLALAMWLQRQEVEKAAGLTSTQSLLASCNISRTDPRAPLTGPCSQLCENLLSPCSAAEAVQSTDATDAGAKRPLRDITSEDKRSSEIACADAPGKQTATARAKPRTQGDKAHFSRERRKASRAPRKNTDDTSTGTGRVDAGGHIDSGAGSTDWPEVPLQKQDSEVGILRLTFSALEFENVSLIGFSQELLQHLRFRGVPRQVLSNLDVRLCDGKVAEVRGPLVAMQKMSGSMASEPVTVMGFAASAEVVAAEVASAGGIAQSALAVGKEEAATSVPCVDKAAHERHDGRKAHVGAAAALQNEGPATVSTAQNERSLSPTLGAARDFSGRHTPRAGHDNHFRSLSPTSWGAARDLIGDFTPRGLEERAGRGKLNENVAPSPPVAPYSPRGNLPSHADTPHDGAVYTPRSILKPWKKPGMNCRSPGSETVETSGVDQVSWSHFDDYGRNLASKVARGHDVIREEVFRFMERQLRPLRAGALQEARFSPRPYEFQVGHPDQKRLEVLVVAITLQAEGHGVQVSHSCRCAVLKGAEPGGAAPTLCELEGAPKSPSRRSGAKGEREAVRADEGSPKSPSRRAGAKAERDAFRVDDGAPKSPSRRAGAKGEREAVRAELAAAKAQCAQLRAQLSGDWGAGVATRRSIEQTMGGPSPSAGRRPASRHVLTPRTGAADPPSSPRPVLSPSVGLRLSSPRRELRFGEALADMAESLMA